MPNAPRAKPNLRPDHHEITALYQKVMNTNGVKHITIGSGIRYDMLLTDNEKEKEKLGMKATHRCNLQVHQR